MLRKKRWFFGKRKLQRTEIDKSGCDDVTEKLITKRVVEMIDEMIDNVEIDEIPFGLTLGCGTLKVVFILR